GVAQNHPENTLPRGYAGVLRSATMKVSAPMGPIRILIADDHAIIRRGLGTLLEHEPGLEVIAEASDGREAIALARRERPNVAILDIAMPNLNGIEAGRQIAEVS